MSNLLDFLYGAIRWRWHLGPPLLVGFASWNLSSKQIAVFFYYKFLYKESREFLVKGRQHLKLLFLVGCDHLGLFSNQIAELFDYLRDNHQVKVACETTSWLGVVSYAFYPYQIEGFFDHQYCWIESSDLRFCLHGDNCQGKAVHVTILFLVGCGLWSHQLKDFFCGSVV